MKSNLISLCEFAKRFYLFEKENKLFEFKIRNHTFWEYIRYNLYEDLIFSKQEKSLPRNHYYLDKLKELGRYLISIRSFKSMKSYDIVLFLTTNAKYVKGKKAEIYMHPVAEVLSDSWRVLLINPYDTEINPTDYPCDVFSLRSIYFIHKIKALMTRFSLKEKEIFIKIKKLIRESFQEETNIEHLAKSLFAFQISYGKAVGKILLQTNPKLILLCDNGDMKGTIYAAHKYGIKVIDLQHSLVSPLNVLYNYPKKISNDQIKMTLPDQIFTFGNYWKDQFQLPVSTYSIGFPHFDAYAGKFLKQTKKQQDKKGIFIPSVLSSRNELAKIAVDLADILPDYKIYYKLRNDEYTHWRRNYLPELGKRGNLIVIDSNSKPTYEYYTNCTYQVGTNSTAIYEGIPFGLETFILKTGWYEEMLPLVNSGAAFLVSNAKEIAEKIQMGISPPHQLSAEDLFKKGSLNNIKNAVATLMN